MEFIKQKAEKLHETDIDLVVRAARNCYQSKGNPENNLEFFKGLIKKGHLSPLEFWRLDSSIFSQVVERTHYNFREYWCNEEYDEKTVEKSIEDCKRFTNHNNWITLEITTNIGIARELMRHRVFSYCQESTRYCNYSKNGLQFIPCKSDLNKVYSFRLDNAVIKPKDNNEKERYTDFIRNITYSKIEEAYIKLIEAGEKPEIARGILPLDTATKVVMGGFKEDWNGLLKQRLEEKTGKVHPQMKELATLIKQEIE